MAAPKPAKLPRWATTGTRTEPTEGEKDAGHIAGTQASAEKMNWLQGVVYDWINRLQDALVLGEAVDADLNLTAARDFGFSAAKTGSALVLPGDFAHEAGAKLDANGALANVAGTALPAVYASFRVPEGATITGLEVFLANSSGGTLSHAVQANAYSYGAINGVGAALITTGVNVGVANGASGWQPVGINAGVVVPAGGVVRLKITLQNSGADGQTLIYGARLAYSFTKLRIPA